MKKKDLLRNLRESALNEMPDILSRIDISKVNIEEPESVKSSFNFRKVFSYTFASLFVFFSGIMIYNLGIIPNIADSEPLQTNIELIGFQTISGTTLIESLQPSDLSYSSSISNLIPLADTEETIEDELDLINGYMNLAETVLGSKDGYIYEEVESTLAEYAFAFVYKGTDLAGNLIQYRGYYNLEETQNGSVYTGIIRHDEETYDFESRTMQNGAQTYVYYKISLDDDNFVEVKNLSTEKVQRFQYNIYNDGILSNQSELTLVGLKNALRAEISIQKRDGETLSLQIERDVTDPLNQRFRINYKMINKDEEGELSVGLKLNQATNKYQYEYITQDNETITKDRTVVSNGRANSDDFKPTPNNGHTSTTTISTVATTTEDTHTTGAGSSTSHDTPTIGQTTTGPGNQDVTTGNTSNQTTTDNTSNHTTTENGHDASTSGPHNASGNRRSRNIPLNNGNIEINSI